MNKYFHAFGFWGRLYVLLILTVFLLIGSVILGEVVAYITFGQAAMKAQETSVLQLIQVFTSIGPFLLPAVIMVLLCCEGPLRSNLMMSKRFSWRSLAICIAIIIVSVPFVSWLEDVNLHMRLPDCMSAIETWMREREDAASELLKKFTDSSDVFVFIINILTLALLPGICEEMYFRVGVQTRLFCDKTRIQGYWAVILTAVLFSAIHLQFFGFLPRMVLGAILGIMLLLTGNVWYSVAAHFFNNTIALTIAYIEAHGEKVEQPQWIESWWAALLSAAAVVAMLVLLDRVEKKSKNSLIFRQMP